MACAHAQAPELQNAATRNGTTIWVTITQRLKTKVFNAPELSPSPILVIVVHGDSPNGPPTYQYRFAQAAAAAIEDVVAAAVLRPGYDDGEGRSDGMRGETTGDNYTPEVIDAVATAISELKSRYKPRKVVLVGHSGGAAIVGGLIGQRTEIANAALLVSCPCDVAAWRRHMQSLKGGRIWERPERSLSPLALVDGVPTSLTVSLLVGSDDRTAPPDLTQAYADALRKHGVPVNVTIAAGRGHDILLEPAAMDELKRIVTLLGKDR
jgi:alpha-beta hydrolase superfamily lysophospholipase